MKRHKCLDDTKYHYTVGVNLPTKANRGSENFAQHRSIQVNNTSPGYNDHYGNRKIKTT